MLDITVCIGSSCHIKGARRVVDRLQQLIEETGVGDKVSLSGTFCMGRCQEGVCVSVGESVFSVLPETADAFFAENVLSALKK